MRGTNGTRDRFQSGALAGWLHFLGLLALGLGANAVKVLLDAGSTGNAAAAVLAGLPQWAFHLIPVIAAISIGMLRFTPAIGRQGLRLALVTTVLMVGLDLVASPGTAGKRRPGSRAGRVRPVPGRGRVGRERRANGAGLPAWRASGVVRRRGEHYPAGHPRLRADLALVRGAYLLLPAILVGLVLGIQIWVAENVTFRTVAAERIGRLLTAWVVSPGAYFLMMTWTGAVSIKALLQSGPLLQILIPLLPFLLVGALGWYKSWRATRWLH